MYVKSIEAPQIGSCSLCVSQELSLYADCTVFSRSM